MLEVLPVVIPTLREVSRGTLRPAGTDAAGSGDARTAAILLDARASSTPELGALYDELELYLQAAQISALRLRRRGRSTVTQMLDILAGVTLLHSRGCERVILIVAADGALPRWERSRAETLASMLELIRRHHSGTARELIGAIEDLVKTIRIVADSVAGVATILVGAPESSVGRRTAAPRSAWQPQSAEAAPHSPKALALSLARGDDHVNAVSQLYLWCRALAGQTPAQKQVAEWGLDDATEPEAGGHSTVVGQLRALSAAFQLALSSLDAQWDVLVGDLARGSPHAAARTLAQVAFELHPAAYKSHSTAQQSPWAEQQTCLQLASRAAWKYLDAPTRLKWLELCQHTYASLRELAPAR